MINRVSLGIILLLFPLLVTTEKFSYITLNTRDLTCLAKNIYHEARGESKQGQIAVGLVTLNRVKHKGFPNSVCEVVNQKNQFSWVTQQTAKINLAEWSNSLDAAYKAVLGKHNLGSFKALYFHSTEIDPNWNKKSVIIIGNHVFYE